MARKGMDDERISQALRQLESNRPPVVAKAAQQLLKLAPGDPRLEQVLCQRLQDSCLRTRAIAASALGELKQARGAQPGAATVAVTVTSLSGEAYHVNVCPSYNVMGLRELLAKAISTTPANIKLMSGATVLEDHWLLKEHRLLQADAQISFIKHNMKEEKKPDASVELLLHRLHDRSENSKMEALRALGQLARGDMSLAEPLLGCLEREFSEGGSFNVAVAAAQLRDTLGPASQEFVDVLARGFWQEFRSNAQFYIQQRDPCHRIEPLKTLADILGRAAPDNPGVLQLLHYFLIYHLRFLGGSKLVADRAAAVVDGLEIDDPRISDALRKVLQRNPQRKIQWNVLMPALEALMQISVDDLRIIERLLTEESPVQKGPAKSIKAAPLPERTLPYQVPELASGLPPGGRIAPGIGSPASGTEHQSAAALVAGDEDDEIPESWED